MLSVNLRATIKELHSIARSLDHHFLGVFFFFWCECIERFKNTLMCLVNELIEMNQGTRHVIISAVEEGEH